jgi:hypothetical protein
MVNDDPAPTVELIKCTTKIYPYAQGGFGTSIAAWLSRCWPCSGVDLIVIVAFFGVVLSRRRWVGRQPGAFKGAVRVVDSEVPGWAPSGSGAMTAGSVTRWSGPRRRCWQPLRRHRLDRDKGAGRAARKPGCRVHTLCVMPARRSDESLTVSEAVQWCAGAISHREATRLRHLTTQAHDNTPKDDSTTAGNIR